MAKPNALASWSVMLNARDTARASLICSADTEEASTARISSGSMRFSCVSLPSIRSIARSGSSIGAVSNS